jgi:hypothetical protein
VRAGIEPDIENVGDLLPLGRIVIVAEETLLGIIGEPGIRALVLEGLEDAGVDRLVLQHVAVLVGEDADRHAPGTLAGENPVGPVLDHRAQTRLSGFRHEAGVVDGVERAGAQRRTVAEIHVHVDEPLRRVAEDDRLLGAPGMRIGVLQPAAREQPVRFDQSGDDGLVGVALLALVVDDARRRRRRGPARSPARPW